MFFKICVLKEQFFYGTTPVAASGERVDTFPLFYPVY